MKKVSTKVLSLLLSLVLILGTVTVAFAADEAPAAPAATYDSKYFQFTTDAKNAKIVLDKVDAALAEADMEPMVLEVGAFTFTVDFTSVNGICKTVDTVYGLWGDYVGSLWVPRLGSKTLVGDLGGQDGLEFKNWTKGMSRKKPGDIKIIEKLITLVADNAHIIGKFIEGNIELGTLGAVLKSMDVDINSLLPAGGFNAILKQGLVSAVYDEGTPAYEAGLAKANESLDKFFYEDMMSDLFSEMLPGLTVNDKTTFDELLKSIFKICWDNYLDKLIKSINVDWSDSENEALKKLSEIMNLNGSTIDTENIPFDESKSFTSQINGIIGYMAEQFFPNYTGWVGGGADKLGKNLNDLYLYAAKALGITAGININDSAAVANAVVKYILANIESDDMDAYIKGIDSCKSLKEMAVVVLRNTAEINGIPVTASASATYENILGDYLTFYVGKSVVLPYDAGAGKNVWTVLNDIANVFLYDKGFAKAFNMKTTKDKDIFTKLDELIGKTKIFDGLTAAKDYSSKTFLTGIIDSLFTLDIAKLVDITVVTFLKDFGNKSVSNVLYDAIYNFLYNWLGKEILVKRNPKSTKPLDDAVTNTNIKKLIVNLLSAINSKKSALIPVILYIGAFVIGDKPAKAEFTIDVQDCVGGDPVKPLTAKAVLDGKTYTLKAGRDFDVVSVTGESFNPGDSASAKLSFYGYATAEKELTFNIQLGGVKNLKATATTNSATLTWDAVPGAQKYEVLNGTKVLASPTTNSAKISLTTATEYKLSVRAVYGTQKGAAANVTVVTLPNKASTPKASSITDTSMKLSWTATTGATGYEVERLDGSKWRKITTVTTNSYTVKSLKAKTTYQFRIRAYKKGSASTAYGEYSSAVKATTLLSAPVLKASSVTDTGMKISWAKVSGAAGYVLEKYDGKKWVTVKKTTSTSYSVTKLKANTTYQYRARAYYKSGSSTVYGAYSSVLKVATAPAKVSGVKLSSPTSTTLKVSWKAVSGASGYKVSYSTNNKSWKTVTTTKTRVTLTKLSANKKYYVKVQAYKTSGSVTAYGQNSSTVTASTNVGQVTRLKATKTTKNSVTLSWKKVSGASGYTVYRQNGSKWVKVANVKSTSYTNTKLSRSTSYKFYVVAYKTVSKKAVYGDKSATVTARTKLF